ncbi:hypothetical protein NM208_g12295 [Fusarium decemcellulare]|uniref:Uncharacterized protein n=1 Tax=Fusarium decemcellulare TaxID=57161 RepID=A0ACC1RR89_9HYPO|nr:hypothetical protein NM208_g12295 [Fusarium decemcellulare]
MMDKQKRRCPSHRSLQDKALNFKTRNVASSEAFQLYQPVISPLNLETEETPERGCISTLPVDPDLFEIAVSAPAGLLSHQPVLPDRNHNSTAAIARAVVYRCPVGNGRALVPGRRDISTPEHEVNLHVIIFRHTPRSRLSPDLHAHHIICRLESSSFDGYVDAGHRARFTPNPEPRQIRKSAGLRSSTTRFPKGDWLALLATVGLAISATSALASPHDTHLDKLFSRQEQYGGGCPVPDICVWGSCTNITIGLDPNECGRPDNPCEPGELCVAGGCYPLDIGSDPKNCTDSTTSPACLPGQWCNNGKCEPIQIIADSRRCGMENKKCPPGSLCVNGKCQDIDIGSDPTFCGSSNETCDSGNWCLDGRCVPFNIGTNVQACNQTSECPLGSSCENGWCRQLFIGTDPLNCGQDGDKKNCTAEQILRRFDTTLQPWKLLLEG